MSTFSMLSRAKSLGFNFTAVLVQAFLEERGFAPIGVIADACGVSPRSVERAIAQLRSHGLLPVKKTTFLSHDHADHSFKEIGAPTAVAACTAVADGKPATVGAAAPDPAQGGSGSPLAERLLAHGILPWCVEQVLAKVDEAVIERQLAYHEHRLATGFTFKAHPARYLFRACLNDYLAPEGFQAPQLVAPVRPAVRAAGLLPATVPPPAAGAAQPAPEQAAPAPMTRAGALSAIRLGMRSRMPAMRAEALRLAEAFGIDPTSLGRDAG